jgi:hypothetical protein
MANDKERKIQTDYGELTIDEDALAYHVAQGNIPADIAAMWLDRDALNEMLRKQSELLDRYWDWCRERGEL